MLNVADRPSDKSGLSNMELNGELDRSSFSGTTGQKLD